MNGTDPILAILTGFFIFFPFFMGGMLLQSQLSHVNHGLWDYGNDHHIYF